MSENTIHNITTNNKDSAFQSLMTRERWIELGRILIIGLLAILYWQQIVPVYILWLAVAIGLYPLTKKWDN